MLIHFIIQNIPISWSDSPVKKYTLWQRPKFNFGIIPLINFWIIEDVAESGAMFHGVLIPITQYHLSMIFSKQRSSEFSISQINLWDELQLRNPEFERGYLQVFRFMFFTYFSIRDAMAFLSDKHFICHDYARMHCWSMPSLDHWHFMILVAQN